MDTQPHTHVVLSLEITDYGTCNHTVLSLHDTLAGARQAALAHFEEKVRDYYSETWRKAVGLRAEAQQEQEIRNLLANLSTSTDDTELYVSWCGDDWRYTFTTLTTTPTP